MDNSIKNQLTSGLFEEVIFLEETKSTNLFAKKLAGSTKKNTIITAEAQTMGRGRKGRLFYSPKNGIYLSLLLFPRIGIEKLQYLTILTAVAVCETITALTQISPHIKWLNDIYLDGKKLGGILSEGVLGVHGYRNIIIGMGLNFMETEIPLELISKITSLGAHSAALPTREAFIAQFLRFFEEAYHKLEQNDFSFMETYRARNFLLGKMVQIESGGAYYKAVHINDLGHLVVQNEQGTRVLSADEVSLAAWESHEIDD